MLYLLYVSSYFIIYIFNRGFLKGMRPPPSPFLDIVKKIKDWITSTKNKMRPVSIIRVNMTRIKIKIIDLFVMLKKSFFKKSFMECERI